ncbi:MAG: TolC family protein [Gemmatimonadota bacterium]|nr:TolC family protein [Gemmatimonadota bacterium]
MNNSILYCLARRLATALAVLLAAGVVSSGYAGKSAGSSLLSSPVPFYHDYNLASMFPVGSQAALSVEAGEAGAGRSLTVDQCIELALEKNPDHNISRQQLRAALGDILAAWGAYVPTMFANYGLSQSNQAFPVPDPAGGSVYRGRISKSSYANLNLSFVVFDGAKKYFGLRNAYYLRKARKKELCSSELELVNEVRAAYFNVLREEKLLLAAREESAQLAEQLRRAEARFSVGEVTRLDVLQARIDLQNQELVILEYENGLVTAKMDLDRVVGGGLGAEFTLADEFEVADPRFEIGKLVYEAVEKHPEMESLRLEIKQQEGSLWIGRLAYLPVLKTTLGYSRSQSELIMRPDDLRGRQVAFSMSWNILDAFARFQQNRYTEVALNSLKYELEKKRLEIVRNIRQSYLDLLRLYQRRLTLAESETMAAESLRLETRRYQLGVSSMVELRKAQADYSQARVDNINSVYDFHEALSELSRNVGRDMSLEYE